MVLLTEDPELTGNEEMMLCSEDFPKNYVNCAHPEDYQTAASAITPEHIYHQRHGKHNHLLWHVSWQVETGTFIPMTFVLDTGAPKQLYLSAAAMSKLEAYNVIKYDEDLGAQWVKLFGCKFGVERTPASHEPANIIGLRMLMRLNLALSDTKPFFTFNPSRSVLME